MSNKNSTLALYMRKKKMERQIMWKKAKANKTCYLFILPYLLLFTLYT